MNIDSTSLVEQLSVSFVLGNDPVNNCQKNLHRPKKIVSVLIHFYKFSAKRITCHEPISLSYQEYKIRLLLFTIVSVSITHG